MAQIFTLLVLVLALFSLTLAANQYGKHRDDDDHRKHRDDDDHTYYGKHDDDDDFQVKLLKNIDHKVTHIKKVVGAIDMTVNTINNTLNAVETSVDNIDVNVALILTDVVAIEKTVNNINTVVDQTETIVEAIEADVEVIETDQNKYFIYQGLSMKRIPQVLCLPKSVTKLDVNIEQLQVEVTFVVTSMTNAHELPRHVQHKVTKQLGDAQDLLATKQYSAACKCLVNAYDTATSKQHDVRDDDDYKKTDDDDHKMDDDDHKKDDDDHKKDDDDHKKDDDDHKKMDDDDHHKMDDDDKKTN